MRTLLPRFDDVVRVAPPPPDIKRTEVELDDRKPQQGLGELYEAEYMQAVTGAADDKVRWCVISGAGRVAAPALWDRGGPMHRPACWLSVTRWPAAFLMGRTFLLNTLR